jgi:acyl-CoA reductase-like NAD-dependent aldehyde dehydrogenase
MMDVRKTYKLYSGGAFVRSESGRTYAVDGVNVPRASRKDVRDAVRAARGAFGGWSSRTAMNRGQVLYRAAEMLDARRADVASLLGAGRAAREEVERAVDALVGWAGWTDKLAQVAGTVNPVAGPYFTFTIPEPMGVVGLVCPDRPALAGLVEPLAAALAGGNTVVALASPASPLPGLVLGEVLATSDVPAAVANILTGQRAELLPHLAGHRDLDALWAAGCSPTELRTAEELAAAGVTRVVRAPSRDPLSPHAALALMEMKTVWHPMGR